MALTADDVCPAACVTFRDQSCLLLHCSVREPSVEGFVVPFGGVRGSPAGARRWPRSGLHGLGRQVAFPPRGLV